MFCLKRDVFTIDSNDTATGHIIEVETPGSRNNKAITWKIFWLTIA